MSLDLFDPATDVTVDGQPLSLSDDSSFGDSVSSNLGAQVNLFFNPDTGEVVNDQGLRLLDRSQTQDLFNTAGAASRREPGALERLGAILKPVNDFLGTSLGRTLGILGLGAAGLGLGALAAGGDTEVRLPDSTPVSPIVGATRGALERALTQPSVVPGALSQGAGEAPLRGSPAQLM
mgnify:FL=1